MKSGLELEFGLIFYNYNGFSTLGMRFYVLWNDGSYTWHGKEDLVFISGSYVQ